LLRLSAARAATVIVAEVPAMPSRLLLPILAFSVALAPALPSFAAEAAPPPGPTADDVYHAIDRGRRYLISRQNPDGSFGADPTSRDTDSVLVFMTLACLGESPNRDYVDKALDYVLKHPLDTTYAVSARLKGYTNVRSRFLVGSRMFEVVSKAMQEDATWLARAQGARGAWASKSPSGADGPIDLLSTHLAVQALTQAARNRAPEIPKDLWNRTLAFYLKDQAADGSWGAPDPSYGPTAASLTSVFALCNLMPPAECPYKNGKNTGPEIDRHTDAALAWLDKHFTVPAPAAGADLGDLPYRLCAIEQVGMASGYKRFAGHDWYVDGVAFLLANQQADGSWGPAQRPAGAPPWAGNKIPDTCFALLFLDGGRRTLFFNKLRFDGAWNLHHRDLANLTNQIGPKWCYEGLYWQIIDLAAPLEELHEPPVLFVSIGSIPKWTEAEKRKLRAFTDTGGTILFETTHGGLETGKWLARLAAEVWPEWPLAPLRADHPVFNCRFDLKERPKLLGIDDGLRTSVYCAGEDISRSWQRMASARTEYQFNWAMNLRSAATDISPWRGKLYLPAAPSEEDKRYQGPLRAGPRRTLRLARMKHGGNWEVGANYGGLARLSEMAKSKLGVNLTVKESAAAPVNAAGVSAADLADFDVAYVAGSRPVTLTDAEIGHLKGFVAKGGFVWAEAADGSQEFDASFRRLAAELGCELRLLPREHPLMTGKMEPARGHDLASGVQFRRSLRIQRFDKKYAELWGLFEGERMVGLYSPFDVLFSMTPYDAYGCRGYRSPDAQAVATNIVTSLTTAPAK
jgi:hypothetical protein